MISQSKVTNKNNRKVKFKIVAVTGSLTANKAGLNADCFRQAEYSTDHLPQYKYF